MTTLASGPDVLVQTEDKVCFTLKNHSITSSEIILISYSKYVEIMSINSMQDISNMLSPQIITCTAVM